jgi:hypothetical protein
VVAKRDALASLLTGDISESQDVTITGDPCARAQFLDVITTQPLGSWSSTGSD